MIRPRSDVLEDNQTRIENINGEHLPEWIRVPRCRWSPESIKLSCLLRYLYPSTASSNSNYVAASKRFHTWKQPRSGSSKHDHFCVLLLLLFSRDTNERDTFARNGTIALDPRQSHAWESNPRVRQPPWARQSRSSSAPHARGRRVRNFSSSDKHSSRYRISRCKRRDYLIL